MIELHSPVRRDLSDAMTAQPDRSLAARLAEATAGLYTIEGEIGRGGMGVVYRAKDERLTRRVAIKVLPPELAFQAEIRERFVREAQTAARLGHPHVVPIHDVGEKDGLVYFVMAYIDGESVGARLKRKGPLPADEARRIMKETADALTAAHALGIVHRDIKPDNILLEGTRGRVMVTDFGIAKALSNVSSATLTGVGIAIGTPQYMSPEQAAGEKEIDGRSDLYSLGIVSYQMLTGELPFNAPTVAGVLMKQITEPAPDIMKKRADCPPDISEAVMKCLEKDPESRWTSAEALRRALESRTATGWRPSGTSYGQAMPRPATRPGSREAGGALGAPPRSAGGTMPRTLGSRPPLGERDASGRPRATGLSRQTGGRDLRRPGRDGDSGETALVRDTGEPKIVQQVRAQFATWAAVNGGLFLLNIATTQLSPPWFLFPAAAMGIGLLRNYAKLWQAGYSWHDVLTRPPAPDSVVGGRTTNGRLPAGELRAPQVSDFGEYYDRAAQVWTDRNAIVRIVDRLPPDERKMLPELQETVDGLARRSNELGRTLHLMAGDAEPANLASIEAQLAALTASDEQEAVRQRSLLERQRKTMAELVDRKRQVEAQFENCRLAMQNLRLDVLKLKSANLQEVLGDLTTATRQAKAISRNVDAAIGAAGEVREAIGG